MKAGSAMALPLAICYQSAIQQPAKIFRYVNYMVDRLSDKYCLTFFNQTCYATIKIKIKPRILDNRIL